MRKPERPTYPPNPAEAKRQAIEAITRARATSLAAIRQAAQKPPHIR